MISIADLMTVAEGFPHPRWEAVAERIAAAAPADRHPDLWAAATRHWLEAIAGRIGPSFGVAESDQVQLLSLRDDELADHLLWYIDYTRRSLLDLFPEVTRFDVPGKLVVMVFPVPELYYAYLDAFFPEGKYGGSAGMQVRIGYPHVVACGEQVPQLQGTLSHELTHVALQHLGAPAWVEEGITQLVDQAATGHPGLAVTEEVARRHKRQWAYRGLGPFWWGGGFHSPGKVQQLSYQLAEVLMRLLIEEHQPGWFGRGKRDRLVGFLKEAKAADAGQAAAVAHLGYTLGTLAGKFLGPGDWEPDPKDAPPDPV